MRLKVALIVSLLLIPTAAALAQDDEEFDDRGSRGARLVGIVVGSACCFSVSTAIAWYFFGTFLQEWQRGRPREESLEEQVKKAPRKQQVMFKGEKVPDWKIAARVKATRAILKFLSYTDNWFERQYVCDVADEAFCEVKRALEERSIQRIDRRVTPDCLEELRTQIKKLRKDREVRVFGRVQVTDVDIVHVEAPPGKENHTFTALVTARSKDFVEDEESGELLHGDRRTYAYEEFYTFRRTEKRWVVELIRPTTDVDLILEAKNVLARIDLEEFAKEADPDHLREVVAR